MSNIKISIIIIARNEEQMIEDALKSIKSFQLAGEKMEVIVVDHESDDNTAKVAKKYGAKVYYLAQSKTKPDFSKARNFGLERANGNWILYLDADERITLNLQKEIMQIVNGTKTTDYAFYAIPRENVVFGKILKHGGWYPDYVKRLFKKTAIKKWEGDLHEEPVVNGQIGHMKNPMQHIKHENLSEMLEKTNNWSEIEAKLMFESGHPPMNERRFSSAMMREFYKRMIRGMAFLDGGEGIIMAMYQVYSRFISYAKLWEMQENSK